MGQGAADGAPPKFFVQLGQFPADGHLPVAPGGQDFSQHFFNPVGRLVQDQRGGNILPGG